MVNQPIDREAKGIRAYPSSLNQPWCITAHQKLETPEKRARASEPPRSDKSLATLILSPVPRYASTENPVYTRSYDIRIGLTVPDTGQYATPAGIHRKQASPYLGRSAVLLRYHRRHGQSKAPGNLRGYRKGFPAG